ncbi:hypothetical protein [Lactobacillus kullabergensis]|uniref:XRE family transcriptional regulator n=1 Tax=Lactobacillus kullabergensis TaxID=1218493 RepID=A0ABN5LFV6_9LACO|nr:hypothetical protein [Lactobacillus kullabergensis]AWM75167.1 hypothetical protein DKL58_03950 [Lactobacillus kullabergensis]
MTMLERIKEYTKKRHFTLTKINEMIEIGTNSIYALKISIPSVNKLKKLLMFYILPLATY